MPTDKKNSLWLSTQYVITILSSLLMLKFNIDHFGKELFGIWIILASVWGVGTTVDFGFGLAIVRYIAQHKNDKEKANTILSSVFFVFVLLGIILFFIGILAAYSFYFNNTKIIQQEYFSEAKRIFLLLGISFLFQYLSIFFRSILEGLNKFIISSRIIILQNLLLLLGVVSISVFDGNIISLAYLYVFSSTVIFITYFAIYRYSIGGYKITPKRFEIRTAKDIFNFSFSIQIMNVSYSLIDPVVKYMLGNYFNVNSIPAYEIARRFATAISGLYFNAFKIILPKASSLKNDEILDFIKNEVVKFSKIGAAYSGLAFGVALLPLVVAMHTIFATREAVIIFMILALPESINNYGYAVYNFLLGNGKARLLAAIQINNLLFVLIGLFVGFRIFNNIFGLLGYFISVVIGNILMLIYIVRHWNVPFSLINARSNLYKLVVFVVVIFSGTFIYNSNIINQYLLFSSVGLISLFLFQYDFREYFSQIYLPIKMNLKKRRSE